MARKKDKGCLVLLALLIPLGLVVKCVEEASNLGEELPHDELLKGLLWPAGIAVVLLAMVLLLAWWVSKRAVAARRRALLEKYQNTEVVEAIMARRIWQGMTWQMLEDSLGKPVAIDDKRLRTRVRQTWKYHQTGRSRYATRIELEDGIVIGWEMKGR